jgi:hypothetical protein
MSLIKFMLGEKGQDEEILYGKKIANLISNGMKMLCFSFLFQK